MPKRQKDFEDLEGTDAGFSFSSHWALEHAETTRWPQTRSSFPNSGYLMLCDVMFYLFQVEGKNMIILNLNVVWSRVKINENQWKSMKIMSTCPRGKNMWQMEALRASEPQVMACRCHTRRHSQAAGMRHSIGHSWSFHIFNSSHMEWPYGKIMKNIWKNIIPYVSIHILWVSFFHIFFHPAATGSACCGGPSKDGQVPFV